MHLARFPRYRLGHFPTPLERLDRLSAQLGGPGAELATIPGASHAAHIEKPTLFNSIVLDFLHTP